MKLVGVEAGGRGEKLGDQPRVSAAAWPGCCKEHSLTCFRTRQGRLPPPIPFPRDWITPPLGPSTLPGGFRPRRVCGRFRRGSAGRLHQNGPHRRHYSRAGVFACSGGMHQARSQDEEVGCGDREYLRPGRQRHRDSQREPEDRTDLKMLI